MNNASSSPRCWGIGRVIAQAFAANGARVHIADVNAEAVREFTTQNAEILPGEAPITAEGLPVAELVP